MKDFQKGDRVKAKSHTYPKRDGAMGTVIGPLGMYDVQGRQQERVIVLFDDFKSSDAHGQFPVRLELLTFVERPVRNAMGDVILEMSDDDHFFVKGGKRVPQSGFFASLAKRLFA